MHIAIIGGGFSGCMLAVHLLERGPDGLTVTLVERRAKAGIGLAFATQAPFHLLNVRAGQMSCRPDDPDHFCRWLATHDPEAQGAALPCLRQLFVARPLYGRYLMMQLQAAIQMAAGHLRLLCATEVTAVTAATAATTGPLWRLHTATGDPILADRVVLATGHLPASTRVRPSWAAAAAAAYHSDPYAEGLPGRLCGNGRILLWGAGLTMADTFLALQAAGHAGEVVALARRGQLPQAHRDGLAPAPQPVPTATSLAALVRTVRSQASAQMRQGGDWRQVVDGLRPHTPDLWRALGPVGQRRFLQHVRPFWDSHRHRTAPAVANQLQAACQRGILRVTAARLLSVRQTPAGGLVARLQPRSGGPPETLACTSLVDCRGSPYDYRRAQAPLWIQLLGDGLVSPYLLPDGAALGLQLQADGALTCRSDLAVQGLYALGPARIGLALESVAVPELRAQAAALANTLLAAA